MLRNEILKEISALPSPTLSVYLNVQSEDASRHPVPDSHEVWMENQVAAISQGLPDADSKQVRKELRRVQNFLHDRHPREKALAIFAGPLSWRMVPLQVPVENEVAWGQPSITQLFWLLHEHHAHGVVVVDHQAARLFVYRLGQLTEIATKDFAVDTSAWKEKRLGHQSNSGSHDSRGPYPDRFEHRLEAQLARLCRETADQTVSLSKQHGFTHVLIAGPDRLINLVQEHLPAAFRDCVSLVRQDLGSFSLKALLDRFAPMIAEREQNRQMASVNHLLVSDSGDIADLDESLVQLQTSGARRVVVSASLNFELRRCLLCGVASRAADPICVICGGEREHASFHELLPVLAMNQSAEVEVVSGEAAQKLLKIGGMGCLSRPYQLCASR